VSAVSAGCQRLAETVGTSAERVLYEGRAWRSPRRPARSPERGLLLQEIGAFSAESGSDQGRSPRSHGMSVQSSGGVSPSSRSASRFPWRETRTTGDRSDPHGGRFTFPERVSLLRRVPRSPRKEAWTRGDGHALRGGRDALLVDGLPLREEEAASTESVMESGEIEPVWRKKKGERAEHVPPQDATAWNRWRSWRARPGGWHRSLPESALRPAWPCGPGRGTAAGRTR
jgi:hypothetical protein